MFNTIIIRNGEIAIKGENRYQFEAKLVRRLRQALRNIPQAKVRKADVRIYVDVPSHRIKEVEDQIKGVFGVVSYSLAYQFEKGYPALQEQIIPFVKEEIIQSKALGPNTSFKLQIKREDKSVAMTSPEMTKDLGGTILRSFGDQLKVDLHDPDTMIFIEFRHNSNILYLEKVQASGGMPIGINGKTCLLLSGGIDSPVAGYQMAKRGLMIDAVHFHSFPFTNYASQEKTESLAQLLADRVGPIEFHSINIKDIQQAIKQACDESYATIIMRRFMMRIAESIALQNDCLSLTTGESLGQVASQTPHGIMASNQVVDRLVVYRPLIAMDKQAIIDQAQAIGTFDTSIIPEEDCCSLFAPKKPATQPKLERIWFMEEKMDITSLIKEAVKEKECKRFASHMDQLD